MIDDFRGGREKKRIEPLASEEKPSIHELYAAHQATVPETELPEPVATPGADAQPFQTPEQIAALEPHEILPKVPDPNQPTAKKQRKFWQFRWRMGRRWTIAFALTSLALISGGALAAYNYYLVPSPGGSFASVRGEYVPKTVPSKLTGLEVDPIVNDRPVIGVMIENSLDARPQSGLDKAGIVFEAIAEAGITRFMALYQDNLPEYVGPVRSVRPYYAQWCMSFDCALAHVGGSPEALSNIKTWKTKDLDQFANSGAYWRISSRFAPHNVYTSIGQLRTLAIGKGFKQAAYTSLSRKKDSASETPTAKTINFTISSGNYNSAFTYVAKTNSYLRSQGGAAHTVTDGKGTQTQLNPKVVVGLIVPYGFKADGYHSDYKAVGSGQAFVFQDGSVQKVTWKKTSVAGALQFFDAENNPVKLNAGQTWITALADAGKVSYQ